MAPRSIAAQSGAEPPSQTHLPAPKLVLASEALREDVAPHEPGRRVVPRVIGGTSLSLALLGIALRHGVGSGRGATETASVAFAAAGALVALALLPFAYAVRAGTMIVLGVVLMFLGANGIGPLGLTTLSHGPGGDLDRFLVLCVLPAALLFRARYRAYPRARLVLGAALLVAVPFAATRVLVIAAAATPFFDRIGAATDLLVILFGLFGFMGDYTTGGGAVWAALVLGTLPAAIALRELAPRAHSAGGVLPHVGQAVATSCAGILVATGIYHLLSAYLARDARRQARQSSA